jgi:hypothetical protein
MTTEGRQPLVTKKENVTKTGDENESTMRNDQQHTVSRPSNDAATDIISDALARPASPSLPTINDYQAQQSDQSLRLMRMPSERPFLISCDTIPETVADKVTLGHMNERYDNECLSSSRGYIYGQLLEQIEFDDDTKTVQEEDSKPAANDPEQSKYDGAAAKDSTADNNEGSTAVHENHEQANIQLPIYSSNATQAAPSGDIAAAAAATPMPTLRAIAVFRDQNSEMENMMSDHTAKAFEEAEPLFTVFPKIQYWTQLKGRLVEEQEQMVWRGTPGSSSGAKAEQENEDDDENVLFWEPRETDFIVSKVWPWPCDICLQQSLPILSTLRNLALRFTLVTFRGLEPGPAVSMAGHPLPSNATSGADNNGGESNYPALMNDSSTARTDNDGRTSRSAHSDRRRQEHEHESFCPNYDMYLTHNEEHPHYTWDHSMWASREAYVTFGQQPEVMHLETLLHHLLSTAISQLSSSGSSATAYNSDNYLQDTHIQTTSCITTYWRKFRC